MATRSTLHGFGLVLLFTVASVTSVQSAGILSNLYKKASQENRPLILVLDNDALNGKSKDLDYSPRDRDQDRHYAPKKYELIGKLASDLHQNRGNERDQEQRLLPLLLQQLGQQNSQDYSRPKPSITRSRLRSRLRERRERLRSRLDDDRDDQDDNRDKTGIKAFIAKNLKDDRDPNEKARDEKVDRALRTSVIKNLLRYSNDLNCAAQNECADKCHDNYSGPKKNKCENKCETKFECQEDKTDDCGGGDCEISDECGGDTNECGKEGNISTRGEKWEEVTDKCKRC